MEIETNAGTYKIEFNLNVLKNMELRGLKPIQKLLHSATNEFDITYTDMCKLLEACAVLEKETGLPSKGFEADILDSGYGAIYIVYVFNQCIVSSPFLVGTRPIPESSENALQVEQISSEDDT